MRKSLFCFLLISAAAFAQTTVTGTVIDPNGNPYANGTASAYTVVASGQSSATTTPVATTGAGSFSLTLATNTYLFTICAPPVQIGPTANPTPKQVCFSSFPIAVSGASMDISAQLNAIAVILGPNFGHTPITTVAGLNGIPGKTKGTVAAVTDAATIGDCTVGLGSLPGFCQYSGTAWGSIGGGGGAFSSLTGGTNTTAAMLVGTGASLGPTGTGTVTTTQPQAGASLPTPPCTNRQFFNLNAAGNLRDTLYVCENSVWQQVKPTVETVYAKDYGVQANAQIISDATTVSGSSTITCPNNDCNFTSANPARSCGTNACVGDIVFAAGVLGATENSTIACPQSTISTINSAQSITLTAANDCTANQTANAQLVWGPDDTTALGNAYTAAVATCTTLQLPSGIMLVQAPLFNTPNAVCGVSQPYRIPSIFGATSETTTIVPTPNFNFANCQGGGRGACFFGVQYEAAFLLGINGLGLTPGGGCGAINLVSNNGSIFFDDLFEGWCGQSSGTTGMIFTANQTEGLFGGTISFGGTDCLMNGNQNQLFQWPCFGAGGLGNPGLIVNGAQFISQGNDYNGVQINSSGSMRSISDRDVPFGSGAGSALVVNGGTLYLDNYNFSTNGKTITPLVIQGAGKVTAINTPFAAPTTGAQINQWLNADSTSQFVDLGGNTYPASSTALSNIPSLLQSRSTSASGGTTPYSLGYQLATCGSTACPGNMLMAVVAWTPSTNTISGCTDTLSNTWTQQGSTITSPSANGAARNIALFMVGNNKPAGGADTLSCSFSSNNTLTDIAIFEWKQSASSFDVAIQTNTGSGTAVSGTQTTVTNNSVTGFFLIDNVAGSISSGTCSPVNPCSAWPNNFPAAAFYGLYQIVPTAGATTSAGTLGSTSDWAGFWFTVRPILAIPPVFGSASITGITQTPANWSTPAGSGAGQWGSSPSVATCSGDSRNQQCTITVGSGTVGANPVLTVTQPTAFVIPPTCDARMLGGTATNSNFTTGTVTTTSAAFTWGSGTPPAASSTIILKVSCSN